MHLRELASELPSQYYLVLIGCVVLYRLVLVVYRFTFHPLAKIPGYKLAVATRLFEYHYDSTLNGRYWVKIQEMHDKLGPIIRINPREVHINDPEFYHQLYNFDPSWYKDEKFITSLGFKKNVQVTIHSALHKRRRAPFENFFSRKEITAIEEKIRKYTDKACDAIEKAGEAKEGIRLDVIARAFTAEIVCGYCFGKQYGFFEDLTAAEDILVNVTRPGELPYVHFIGRFSPLLQQAIAASQALNYKIQQALGLKGDSGGSRFFAYAQKLVDSVKKDEKSRTKKDLETFTRSIFHELLDSDLPASEKSNRVLFENAVLFLFAGFETTGFSLTLGVASILANKTIHARLKDELRSLWPDVENGSMPSWAELERLPLLHACILESLRLSCGVLSRLSRITDHDIVFKSYVIPAGTPISMSQPLIHYNPDIFPEPLAFKPDRWLEGTPAERKALERYLVSFSGGSRICIGKNLAWAELHIALASFIRKFEDMRVTSSATGEDLMPYTDAFIPIPKAGKQVLVVEVH